jgi:predicted ATP-grasp superfamily ATP-dependent carboligase
LVGEAFLNAEEFSYCGSIGPLKLNEDENEQWQHIGHSLTAEFGLKGLFGVDAICHAGDIYPLEVNPRYTASVEVVELALQLPVIAMHCDACNGKLPSPILPVNKSMMGKAYLFAHHDLISPGNVQQLYNETDAFPLTADMPQADRLISQGHPVMTLIAQEKNQDKVLQSLKSRAKLLYNKFDLV